MRLARSTGRWVVGAAVCGAVLFAVGGADAQTISFNNTSPNPDRIADLPDDEAPYGISYEYCADSDVFTFLLTASGSTDYTLEVYAGQGSTDCMQDEVRRDECWFLYQDSNLSNDSSNRIEIPVQSIVAMDMEADFASPHSPSVADCNEFSSSTAFDVTIYFLLTRSTDVYDSEVFTGTVIDMNGPGTLGEITATPGEERAVIHWGDPGSDIESYVVYCAPADDSYSGTGGTEQEGSGGAPGTGGSEPTAAAGAPGASGAAGRAAVASGGTVASGGAQSSAGTAGATATAAADEGTGNSSCPSALREGQPPPLDDPSVFQCGSRGDKSAREAIITGLENNVTYAVAVAGVDDVGNIGVLSQVECVTPIEVDDFFEVYREAGGKGGGGFCSISQRTERGLALLLAGAFGALCWRRRRR